MPQYETSNRGLIRTISAMSISAMPIGRREHIQRRAPGPAGTEDFPCVRCPPEAANMIRLEVRGGPEPQIVVSRLLAWHDARPAARSDHLSPLEMTYRRTATRLARGLLQAYRNKFPQ